MIYHARKDVYHCCYRLLTILSVSQNKTVEINTLKMIDFFLVFPHFSADISFPRAKGVKKLKKYFDSIKPFENMPNKKILFSELNTYQNHALLILKAKNLIEIDNTIVHQSNLFDEVSGEFTEDNQYNQKEFLELIIILLSIDPYGKKGLKAQTGLMEYRYDTV